ncbi:MAG: phosphate ABC transporter permease subunit PstC [Chloroflexi bacterium HGW-Chloroflexi-10]|nr:MAG: phosphate ABC transporter permease subunit PstC [Chloroflexi bacterium HGW-Chloroflexi-10]
MSTIFRKQSEKGFRNLFFFLTLLPGFFLAGILIMLILRSMPILEVYSIRELFLGVDWKPLQGKFGYLPFIVGTFWVTFLGLGLAVPPSLLTAIYLAEYAGSRVRIIFKPVLDILAAIPSVVYGVWGILVIVPVVEKWIAPFAVKYLGVTTQNPTGYGILSGSMVVAVMIIPFLIAVLWEIIETIPRGLREASLSLGTTQWEMIHTVIFPLIFPGIIAAITLGASRAFGETMAVLMVVGNVPQIPSSIFDAAYPLPALIANNYGEMMSIPLYDAALMGAALILLVIVLFFNIIAALVLSRYKKNRNRQ